MRFIPHCYRQDVERALIPSVELEIRPEPSPRERKAIENAFERLLAAGELPAAYRSRWREAGIAENIEFGKTAYATARPRSSPGATRA
jgi:hypothetical protein